MAVALLGLMTDGSAPAPAPPAKPPPQRLVVVHPADGLGAIAAGFGDLWVDDRSRERLLRVDGRSGRVRAEIPVDGRVALTAGTDDIWALQSGGGYGIGLRGPLLRIDPRTDRVRERIALGPGMLGFGVQTAGRSVWVWGPHAILRIDPRAGRVAARIDVGARHGELTGFAASGARLLAGAADGHLLRFDARTGRRTGVQAFPLRRPSLRAFADGRVLVTAAGVVGALAWRRRLGFRAGATVTGDGLVWAHSSALHEPGDRVTALRLATGRIVTSGIVPAFGTTGIAVVRGQVALATAGGSLLLLRPFSA